MLARRNRPTRPKARLLLSRSENGAARHSAASRTSGSAARTSASTWVSNLAKSHANQRTCRLVELVFVLPGVDRIENLCPRGKTTLFLPPTGDDGSFSNKCRQLRRPYLLSSDKRTRTCSAALELSFRFRVCVPAKLSISRRVLRSIVGAAPAFFGSSRADNAPKLNRDLI